MRCVSEGSDQQEESTHHPSHDREEPRDGRDELPGPVVPCKSLGGSGVVGVSVEGPAGCTIDMQRREFTCQTSTRE